MLCYNCMREKGDAAECPFCHAQNSAELQPHHIAPGTVLGNRYTLGRVIGEGGFGITYIGKEKTLGITAAIKEYYPFGFCNRNATMSNTVSIISEDKRGFYEQGRSRFLKEARTLAKFQGEPGVVNVIDFIEENNTAYIVMEYLDGITLREYLKSNGKLGAEQTVQMLLPMMRALEKIHRAGVIHRDVSPDNIMMLRDGSVKLMDFGAARDYDGDNRSMSIMLKQGYAPEEQYRRNGEQGPWTDVYGVCATIYRCITGTAPVEALDRLYSDALQRPSERGVPISPAMEEALMYGLALHRHDRCPDMDTLISMMENALITPDAVSNKMVLETDHEDPDMTVYAEDDLVQPPSGYQQHRSQRPYSPGQGDFSQQSQQGYGSQQGYSPQRSYNPQQGYNPQRGYSPQQYRPQQYNESPVGKKRSYAPLIVAICLAAFALTVFIGVLFFVNHQSNTESSGSNSSSSSAELLTEGEKMPNLIGMTREEAVNALAGKNLSVSDMIEIESDEQSPGKVLNQVPQEGYEVNENTKVTIYIAKAKATQAPATSASSAASSKAADPSPVTATTLYCTAETYVALHTTSDVSSTTIRKIWRGQSVKLISASDKTYYVEAGGVRGYASALYLSSRYSDVPAVITDPLYVNNNVDFLALRQTASENGTKITEIPPGAAMTFLGNVVDNGGVNSAGYHVQWAYVKYGSYTGYVYDYYLHD